MNEEQRPQTTQEERLSTVRWFKMMLAIIEVDPAGQAVLTPDQRVLLNCVCEQMLGGTDPTNHTLVEALGWDSDRVERTCGELHALGLLK